MAHISMFLHSPHDTQSKEQRECEQYLAQLLGRDGLTTGRRQVIPADGARDVHRPAKTADFSLSVSYDVDRSWWRRHLCDWPMQRLVKCVPSSLLIVRRPRRAVGHILLVARGDETDWDALRWTIELAVPNRALVTILPIVPPWPSLHRLSRWVEPTPDVLLSPSTPSGARLKCMVSQLQRYRIPALLTLHTGEPDRQIHTEVDVGNPDLIVIAAESHSRMVRLLCGELVAPLLRWLDRPILIAKPVIDD